MTQGRFARFIQSAVPAFRGATVAATITLVATGGVAFAQHSSKLASSTTAAVSALPAAFRWGVPLSNGLQLGTQVAIRGGQETSLINCLIRNQGKGDAQYNDYFLGNWEKTEVWARPVGSPSWARLERDPASQYVYLSVGPGNRYHTLKPGQKLLWRATTAAVTTAKGKGLHYAVNYVPYAEYKPVPASVKTVNFLPFTFDVILDDFVWPATWKGKVEVQIVHTLLANGRVTDKKNEQFKLTYQPARSGSVTLSSDMVRVLQAPRTNFLLRGYIPPTKARKTAAQEAPVRP